MPPRHHDEAQLPRRSLLYTGTRLAGLFFHDAQLLRKDVRRLRTVSNPAVREVFGLLECAFFLNLTSSRERVVVKYSTQIAGRSRVVNDRHWQWMEEASRGFFYNDIIVYYNFFYLEHVKMR